MATIYDLLNDLYDYVPLIVFESIRNAIQIARNEGELVLVEPHLRTLISSVASFAISYHQAVEDYVRNTPGSPTHQAFR